MKELFDQISEECSKNVTKSYSTSFSLATKMLSSSIRQDIYNIYGFVRFADEIVDTFHNYNKEELFKRFVNDLNHSLKEKISLNPILNSFQKTVHKYGIEKELIDSFLKSMKQDLKKKNYKTSKEYKDYIYGSADVVGLMCLKVFVSGNESEYKKLKPYAMSLGSAFQKVNFLRDLNDDYKKLDRIYFPGVNYNSFDENTKNQIMVDIEKDKEIADYFQIKVIPGLLVIRERAGIFAHDDGVVSAKAFDEIITWAREYDMSTVKDYYKREDSGQIN